ncbi:hypothetical protein ASF43_10695 [Pseudorhodoferax sp. Leaf267]|nr:hypothetical protein ASF43_10695 [Pseudorhodoferax sp. Leaf267]
MGVFGAGPELHGPGVFLAAADDEAVHDQAGVALDLGHILAVVVDAVAVEGQRGIAEQQHVVGNDAAHPRGVDGGRRRRGRGLARGVHVAVDDVVLLQDRQLAIAADFVVHLDEDQRPGAADPAAQVVDVQAHRARLLVCVGCRRACAAGRLDSAGRRAICEILIPASR